MANLLSFLFMYFVCLDEKENNVDSLMIKAFPRLTRSFGNTIKFSEKILKFCTKSIQDPVLLINAN